MSTSETRETLPAGTWNADPVHSDIGFSIDYMAGTFRGGFSRFEAQLMDGDLKGSADVTSVQVKDPNLQAHLQTPEFFDAERHPKLTFSSKQIRASGNELTLDGEITIKGHTEAVQVRGTMSNPISDPFGNERFGLRLSTTLDRTHFGINWNADLPTGQPALSNDVTLDADLQFVKAT
jgi:polyisoprenoid-binding protein YceI